MDPATATLITTLGSSFLSAIFSPPKPQISPEQIAALLEKQRQAEEAKQRAWLIGGGLAAAALVAYVVISRK